MKTLHLYLLRQVTAALLLTVTVFTFVLLLGNVLREILLLMMNQQASLLVVAKAIGLLIPWVLVFALPMGMLTATLLVFGRFSADQELTAVRAGGISLVALVTPVLLLSVVLTGVTGWFNLQLAPQARVAYKRLLWRIGVERPTALLAENQFIREFPGFVIYVRNVNGDTLHDLLIYEMATNAPAASTNGLPIPAAESAPRVERILSAATATVSVDPTNRAIQLHLPEVQGVEVSSGTPTVSYDNLVVLNPRAENPTTERTALTDMTFAQLMTQYYEFRRLGVNPLPVAVQMHRQIAFSFACLGFTLIGIPLGIRAHRRETSIGVGIALLLVLVYYAFLLLAQAWDTYPGRHPELIMWIPNLLFQGIGAGLLWRANRRG